MLQIFNYLDSCDNALFHTVHPECAVFIINAGTYRHVFTLFLQVITHDIAKQSVLFLRYSGACDQICMRYRLAATAYHVVRLIKAAEKEFSDGKKRCYRTYSDKCLIYIEMLHDHLSGCRKQKHLYDCARLMSTEHFHKLHADCKRHDIFHVILQLNFIMPYIKKALPDKLYNKHHYHKHQYCRQKKLHIGCNIFHCFSQELLHHHLFLSLFNYRQ